MATPQLRSGARLLIAAMRSERASTFPVDLQLGTLKSVRLTKEMSSPVHPASFALASSGMVLVIG